MRELVLSNGTEPRSEARKPRTKQHELGQYLTPDALAIKMVRTLSISKLDEGKLLDPCFGPGTFINALDHLNFTNNLSIDAYEIDENIAAPFILNLRRKVGHRVNALICDYLLTDSKITYDYAILNPPYVRQEWIRNKNELRKVFNVRYGVDIPGTSNLYA